MTHNTQTATGVAGRKKKLAQSVAPAGSKLDQLQALLVREGGATIAELMTTAGWQQHSVRGALAGALRKRGLTVTSDKVDGVRRYTGSMAAQ